MRLVKIQDRIGAAWHMAMFLCVASAVHLTDAAPKQESCTGMPHPHPPLMEAILSDTATFDCRRAAIRRVHRPDINLLGFGVFVHVRLSGGCIYRREK